MLRFLSKVKLQYNALDARAGTCREFLAQCISKDSNSSCQVQLKHRTDDHPPQINVTFINGVEEVFDASTTSAQTIRSLILQKGHYLETEQMFRDAGETWPVIIPDEELRLPAPGIKLDVLWHDGDPLGMNGAEIGNFQILVASAAS